jgi:hypothetical protein
MAGKKGVMPPQFAKYHAAAKAGVGKAKGDAATHKQIMKHAAAVTKHIAQINRLAGK